MLESVNFLLETWVNFSHKYTYVYLTGRPCDNSLVKCLRENYGKCLPNSSEELIYKARQVSVVTRFVKKINGDVTVKLTLTVFGHSLYAHERAAVKMILLPECQRFMLWV